MHLGEQAGASPGGRALTAPPLTRRMASWVYEGLLLFGVVVPAAFVFSIATQMRHALQGRLALALFLFLVVGLYCVWFWSKGQTLAMKTWRIELVDTHGRRVQRGRAALRYLFSWIWFLPPLAAVSQRPFVLAEVAVLFLGWVAVWAVLSRFHPERQFWHDALAGTRLVAVA